MVVMAPIQILLSCDLIPFSAEIFFKLMTSVGYFDVFLRTLRENVPPAKSMGAFDLLNRPAAMASDRGEWNLKSFKIGIVIYLKGRNPYCVKIKTKKQKQGHNK